MPAPTTQLGILTLNTYTFALALMLLLSAGAALHLLQGRERPGAVIDCLLAAGLGGLIGGRALHVLVHWAYFREHLGEITRLRAGGLEWQGVLVGGLLLLTMMARIRRVALGGLRVAIAPALPLVAFGAWYGCWAARCAYGAEVATLAAFPAWLVWEAPDLTSMVAPRFRTQALGLAWAGVLAICWCWRRHSTTVFWEMLALLSVGMFGIGFLRGDVVPLWRGLRVDQWLDAAIFSIALCSGIIQRRSERTAHERRRTDPAG